MYSFDQCPDHRVNGSYRWKQPAGAGDIIGMDTADMDFESPPCLRNVLQAVVDENTFNYREIPARYYEAVHSFYSRNYSLNVPDAWMSTAPGTIGAIRMALELFAPRGTKVLMQTPYFGPLKRAIEGAGCEPVLNPLKTEAGRFCLDVESFEETIKTASPSVFLLVNPHNPTGHVFTMEELRQMAAICCRYGVKIISDEVHSLITYDGNKHIPILAVSEEARDISVQVVSVSKAFNMMALPHAIVTIANGKMMEAWKQCLASYSFSYAYNAFSIPAVTAVLAGQADAWRSELNQYLLENRGLLYRAFSDFPGLFKPYQPEAGYLMWVDCANSGLDLDRLDDVFLHGTKIRLNNGSDHGSEGRGYVRINFALTRNHLEQAMTNMRHFFDGLGK